MEIVQPKLKIDKRNKKGKKKIIGKRAVFFTFFAILLISAFIMIYSFGHNIHSYEDIDATRSNVVFVNSFFRVLNSGLVEQMVRTSTVRALTVMSNKSNIAYNNDINATLTELLINGTINKNPVEYMANFSLKRFVNNITYLSAKYMNIKTNMTFSKFYVNQSDPWSIDVFFNVTYNISKGIVRYNVTDLKHYNISILGLNDPLFEANGFHRKIYATNISNWTIENVTLFYQSHRYRARQGSPSYLFRLMNKSWQSQYGIESFLNASVVGMANYSYVDFMFWNNRSFNCTNHVLFNVTTSLIPDDHKHLLLDTYHIGYYNISKDNWEVFCSP